jgi:hypothetical protein
MATTQNYEVLVPELTVHRQVGELRDPITDTVVGIQQGMGRTLTAGTIVSAADLSPILLEALENEDHPSHEAVSRKLRPVSEDSNEEIFGVPIAGYDDLDEDQILAIMAVLPSAQVQAIKQYESLHDNRGTIVNYSIGFGESPEARQTGLVSSDLDEPDEDKAVNKIRTRNVDPEADGEIVEPGEGITGTGERQIPPGTAAAQDDDGEPKKKVARRGRRPRPQQQQGGSDDSGSGSSGSSE